MTMTPNEYTYIKREVRKTLGLDLNCYKAQQMQRRLCTFLLRSGKSDWPTFFRTIRHDPVALGELKDYLTINVSSFFRDSEKYTFLRRTVLPRLLEENAALRIWSAGCSRGQEPYTIAMILEELSGSAHNHRILATDLDRTVLKLAKAGGPYSADDVANVPESMRRRYFQKTGTEFRVKDSVRRRVQFRQHNLLAEPFGRNYDLIICRNVVIYFQMEVKERLYRSFYDGLRPGGTLFVGGTEIIPRTVSQGFEVTGVSFYRRVI